MGVSFQAYRDGVPEVLHKESYQYYGNIQVYILSISLIRISNKIALIICQLLIQYTTVRF